MVAVVVLLLVVGHFFLTRELLEIRRLLIIGDFAFIPGYSHFEPVNATLALPIAWGALSLIASIAYLVFIYYGSMEATERLLTDPFEPDTPPSGQPS